MAKYFLRYLKLSLAARLNSKALLFLNKDISVTADRDARRSDDSNKCEGVRQQCIIKY